MRRQRLLLTVLFLALPLFLLITFTYIPAVNMIRYSFFRWDGTSPVMQPAGLANYVTLFSQTRYLTVMANSLYYLVGSFIQLFVALVVAYWLSFKLKGTNFFKGVFFFPYLLNGVAVALMFLFFFEPQGTLNTILRMIGGESAIRLWLTEPFVNNTLLATISIWRYIGFNIVLFIAVIQSISSELYEAAEIDGANRSQILWLIVVPNIKMIILLNLILAVKGAISVFEVPFLITGGDWGTSTFVIEALAITFGANPRYGLGSAFAVVLFVIIIIVTLIQRALLKEE
ncbi:MAG: sugar ABC transporter permease [Acholeplasmataceae bacterium]|nr:MAG: sugar ABC transporter permease [Acholeplasmataceae bacterium]